MPSIEEADSWIGRTAVDVTGEQIGLITRIWVDDASAQPELASVKVASSGVEALVPLAGAVPLGGGRQFAYTREQMVDAPPPGADGRLEVEEKESVSAYYAALASEPMTARWVDRFEHAPAPVAGSEPSWLDEAAPTPRPRLRGRASSARGTRAR